MSSNMKRCLILAEHDNRVLKTSTLNTISCAQKLSDHIDVLVVGFECHAVAQEASTIEGITSVVQVDAQEYTHFLAENIAKLCVEIRDDYDYLLAPATTFGKNILPRVAALCDVGQISDVIEVVDSDTFLRPIYAGNAIETIRSLDAFKVLTVRTSAFCAANNTGTTTAVPIINCDRKMANSHSTFISDQLSESSRPELSSARIIVSGGRALGSAENFALIERLADELGAGIGASRAAVDAGFVPNDYQVGQTGKIVAPDLYIAVGISGAIQHIAGMKDSKVIVAINKDPEAPIFKIATYGLVGDLFVIVPELIEELKLKSGS